MNIVVESYQSDLENAVKVIGRGGVILYPTDTIWGLGCDATNDEAIERIFDLKERSDSKALISLVDSIETLQNWVEVLPSLALQEMKSARRPLTIIYDNPKGLSKKLMADDGSAAFRIPTLDFTQELCRRIGVPLVSTSANISGAPSPASFQEIDDKIIKNVDYVCLFGREKATKGLPSRILKINNDNKFKVIRE